MSAAGLLAGRSQCSGAIGSGCAGRISGTVTDPQGNAVAGAQGHHPQYELHVYPKSGDTTDSGNFSAAMLYSRSLYRGSEGSGLRIEEAGARDVRGLAAAFNSQSGWGSPPVSQSVTVTAHGRASEGNTLPPAINQQAPEVSNTLAGLTVTYLPNRDRDFSQFGQLAAGVQACSHFGRTGCGRPAAQTHWAVAVDGADFTDPL